MRQRHYVFLFAILSISIIAIAACNANFGLTVDQSIDFSETTSSADPPIPEMSEVDQSQKGEPNPSEPPYLNPYETEEPLPNEGSSEEIGRQNSYITTAYVNLREGPSTNHRVLTTVPKGDRVLVTAESEYWLEVEYGQHTGFISALYLTPDEGTSSTESVDSLTAETVPIGNSRSIPILMYHAIDEYTGKGIKELYVTPENFKNQMEYIKMAGFTPITFEDLPKIDEFERPIMITFDDGYKNNMNAYEIFKELSEPGFQAKGTIFMVGKKIDSKSGLSTAQLKELSDSGIMSIQSHTETHPDLTETVDLTTEMRDIKWKLERITGKPVIAFAYPSGKYDERVLAEAKKYYTYAVTTNSGRATLDEPYTLKRIRINYSTSLDAFKQLLDQ